MLGVGGKVWEWDWKYQQCDIGSLIIQFSNQKLCFVVDIVCFFLFDEFVEIIGVKRICEIDDGELVIYVLRGFL